MTKEPVKVTFFATATEDEVLAMNQAAPGVVAVAKEASRIKAERENARFGDDPIGRFIAKTYTAAEAAKKSTLRWDKGRQCSLCQNRPEPILFKSGPRKGQVKTSSREQTMMLFGLDTSGFIKFANSAEGICRGCATENARSRIEAALREAHAEVRYGSGHLTPWRLDDSRICMKCKSVVWESEMGRLPTLMGGGTYPGVCSRCDNKSLPLGPKVFDYSKEKRLIRAWEATA